jgi:hypothetical protein
MSKEKSKKLGSRNGEGEWSEEHTNWVPWPLIRWLG